MMTLKVCCHYSAPDRGAEYCNERVCVCVRACVCLSVSLSIIISSELHVAQFTSGGVLIRYVLPVLWMTSYLLISQGCLTSQPG